MTAAPRKAHFNDYSFALRDVFSELHASSERAAAIVAFAYLDETIHFALDQLFGADPEVRDVLDQDSPSAAKKIDLLRNRIILEEEVYRDLHLLRQIRNRFAHWYDRVSFESGTVRQWCGSLQSWRRSGAKPTTGRERFSATTEYICFRVLVQVMDQY